MRYDLHSGFGGKENEKNPYLYAFDGLDDSLVLRQRKKRRGRSGRRGIDGSGALISGASRLDNTEGIHSYNGTQFYGETLEWTITADAGQRSIVCAIKGSDIDAAGSLYDIVSAIKLSVSRSKNIGVWYIGSAITESELNNLNNELNNGRWVVACFSFGYSGHVIVIKDYDSATTCYTIWDPWDDSTKLITKYQLCNNMIQLSESGITYTLDAVVYCR